MSSVEEIVEHIKGIKGLTRKTKIKQYLSTLSESSRAELLEHGSDDIKTIIHSLYANAPPIVHNIAPSEKHAEWSNAVLKSTEVTGRIPSTFYDTLKDYRSLREETWEGSTGTAFVFRERDVPIYIIKSMNDDRNFTSRGKEKETQKMIHMIRSIKHEMNVNIDVTNNIPQYVSKCLGTYLSYEIEATRYKYQAYFVFEYVPGMPLNVWIQKNKNKETYANQSRMIVDSLHECVRALHATGYVHRDLKPKNVYVVQPNSETVERCVLIDFGEALRIGTPENMEKIRGMKEVSNNAENDEIFNPLLANTTTDRFFNRYNGRVTPEQNTISFERIRNLPIENGGLFQRSVNISELHNAFPGVFVKSKQLGGTRKKNRRTHRKTYRKH